MPRSLSGRSVAKTSRNAGASADNGIRWLSREAAHSIANPVETCSFIARYPPVVELACPDSFRRGNLIFHNSTLAVVEPSLPFKAHPRYISPTLRYSRGLLCVTALRPRAEPRRYSMTGPQSRCLHPVCRFCHRARRTTCAGAGKRNQPAEADGLVVKLPAETNAYPKHRDP